MTGKRTATTGEKPKLPTVVINDPNDQKGALKEIGGSKSDHWNSILANQTIQTLWVANSDPDVRAVQYAATTAALVGIGPQDELEGMMAAQLVAAHNAAMECYRRAMIGEQTPDGRCESLSQANKLSRTYAALIEALNRHRGKGQQKVTVEHVHVHSGGQAIVGNVEGGGDRAKLEGQPHAITYAPGETLWSKNAEREAMPVAGNGEFALPNARRHITGRTEG
jgi:hypothetical protein